jgi:Undecaprenyl-phosphate glucose phosphotransferase
MSLTSLPAGDARLLSPNHGRAEKTRAPDLPPNPVAAEPVANAISPVVLTGVVRIIEFVMILLVGIVVHDCWVYPTGGWTNIHLAAAFFVPFVAVVLSQALKNYSIKAFRTYAHQLSRLAAAWTLVFFAVLALLFLANNQTGYSRAWIGGWFAAGLMVLFAWRIGLAALVRHWINNGRLIRRVVIVGGGEAGEALVQAINAEAGTDLRICGIFDDRSIARSPPIVAGVPKIGTVDDLVRFTRCSRVDLILVSLPLTAEARVLQMVRKLCVLPVDVRLAAHMHDLRFRPRAYSYIANVPVLDISDKPIGDWNLAIKTVFDHVASGLLLVVLAPLMVAVAVAIKLDSKGPVLFRQRRHGFNNQVIEVLKFRTLHHEFSDPNAKRTVVKGDPRVTRVGRVLRKTSIDELPQLVNVLRGELSLVGPRPHALNASIKDRLWEDVVDKYYARHRVKPGLTGWAQVNGSRGGLETTEQLQRRIDHDLYYIENWSLLFDIYILCVTPFALFDTDNAY